MSDIYDVIVDVKRANPGTTTTGHVESPGTSQPVVIPGVALRKHQYSARGYERLEGERTAGVRGRKLQLFLTRNKPFPAIEQDDILLITSGQGIGQSYNVLNVREYVDTLQLDTEQVK